MREVAGGFLLMGLIGVVASWPLVAGTVDPPCVGSGQVVCDVANGWTLTKDPAIAVVSFMQTTPGDNGEQDITLMVPFGSIGLIYTIYLELPQANLGMSNQNEEFFNISVQAKNNTGLTWYDFEVLSVTDFNVLRGTKPAAVPTPNGTCPFQGGLGRTHPRQAHVHPAAFAGTDSAFTIISPNTQCGVFSMEMSGGVVPAGLTWYRTFRFHDGVVPADAQGTTWSFQLQPSIPEPNTSFLLASGLLALSLLNRRRRRRQWISEVLAASQPIQTSKTAGG